MKTLTTLIVAGLALGSVGNAYARADRPDIERLGKLIQSNSAGNARYFGDSSFVKTGKRSYITRFAKMLAKNTEDVPKYEVVLREAITNWEAKKEFTAYTSDLSGALALYTVTNLSIAQHEDAKDYLIPNLVDQYKKCLSSRTISRMSNERKEDLYDYMVTESIYQEVLIASQPDMKDPDILAEVRDMSTANVRDVFGVSPTVLSVTESGLTYQ